MRDNGGIKDTAYKELVHNPADLAAEYVQWAELHHNVPGVPFGVEAVDKKMIPAHPGDMVVICGRPGHGKSSILAAVARAEAKRIQQRGTFGKEIVVYVTFEQVVEEMEAMLQSTGTYSVSDLAWGRVDLDLIKQQAVKRVHLPIWVVGNSLSRTNENSPRMYPETVFLAIESMKRDYGVKVVLLLIDYIQLIPIRSQADRQKQVIEAAHRVKEIAQRVGCPAFVAAQARREVDTRQVKIPGLWDAQWSSSIEQTADKFFSLWRPWLTESHFNENGNQAMITVDGNEYPVTPELLVMAMQKQRFENGRWSWALHFDPAYLKLCDMELRKGAVPWD